MRWLDRTNQLIFGDDIIGTVQVFYRKIFCLIVMSDSFENDFEDEFDDDLEDDDVEEDESDISDESDG